MGTHRVLGYGGEERAGFGGRHPRLEARIVEGDPGRALVDLAGEVAATVIVLGTRGHGGLRRAMLGSVSDHVVRNAPCSVLITT